MGCTFVLGILAVYTLSSKRKGAHRSMNMFVYIVFIFFLKDIDTIYFEYFHRGFQFVLFIIKHFFCEAASFDSGSYVI